MKKQAKKSAVTFDMPMIGPITLNEQDVDKIIFTSFSYKIK